MTWFERARSAIRNFICCGPPPEPDTSVPDDFLTGPDEAIEPDATVATLLRKAIMDDKVDPRRVALECLNNRLTFAEVELFSSVLARDIVDRMGDEFVVRNPDGDKIIAVIGTTNEKLVICILAIWKAGFTYLPLDRNQTESVLWRVVNHFLPVAIIADDNSPIYGKFKEDWSTDFKVMCFEDIWFQMSTPDSIMKRGRLLPFPIIEVKPVFLEKDPPVHERVAAIFHMFGTGDSLNTRPCGVRVSHQAILNTCFWSIKTFPFKRKDNGSLTLPLADIDSLRQMFSALLDGIQLVILTSAQIQRVENFSTAIRQSFISHVTLYASEIIEFLQESRDFRLRNNCYVALPWLRYVFCTEAVDKDTAYNFLMFTDRACLVCLFTRPECSGVILYEVVRYDYDLTTCFLNGYITYGSCVNNTKFCLLSNVFERARLEIDSKGFISGPQIPMGFVGGKCHNYFQKREHLFRPLMDTKYISLTKPLLETSEVGQAYLAADGKFRYFPMRTRDGQKVREMVHKARFSEFVDYSLSPSFAQNDWKVVLK